MMTTKYDYAKYWSIHFPSQKEGLYIPDILKIVKSYKPKSILEIGSGMGHTSRIIKQQIPCHLTGIDIVKGNDHLDEYIHADLTEYDTDNKYDCIIAQNVLLHIKPSHIKSLLSRMFRWSKNIVILDYDPEEEIPLADHNFKHDYSIFPHKQRISATNSIWYT